MNKPTVQSKTLITLAVLFIWSIPAFSQNSSVNKSGTTTAAKVEKGNMDTLDSSVLNLSKSEEANLTELQKQARLYRTEGLQYQKLGNLDSAKGFYQKAMALDPSYAAPYNDLGVILEAEGLIDSAEQCYLQSLKIDPNYLSAYSNLALLYENERDLDKAAFFWSKRVEMGLPTDPWTIKASKRLQDIRAITAERPFKDMREQEIVDLMTDVSVYKSVLKKDDKALAASYMRKAKMLETKGDGTTALKMAIDAAQLDPNNKDIQSYVDKLQIRALSK